MPWCATAAPGATWRQACSDGATSTCAPSEHRPRAVVVACAASRRALVLVTGGGGWAAARGAYAIPFGAVFFSAARNGGRQEVSPVVLLMYIGCPLASRAIVQEAGKVDGSIKGMGDLVAPRGLKELPTTSICIVLIDVRSVLLADD